MAFRVSPPCKRKVFCSDIINIANTKKSPKCTILSKCGISSNELLGILLLGSVVAKIIMAVQTIDFQYFSIIVDVVISIAIYHTKLEQPKSIIPA